MKTNLQKELPLIIIVLIPFVYLAYVWNSLPEKVPLHWNMEGEIDRYGEKSELILIPVLLPLLIYVLFTIIPKIDPKRKIKNMGNKYTILKSIMTLFMSALAMIIIYAALNETLYNPNYIVLLIGILFALLGNYFKTLRANYFIGIKTPWTLENETVWKATHKLAGKLWFAGGLLIVLTSILLDKKTNFTLFAVITVFITVIPVVYSYIKYQSISQTNANH
ncbi:SdpI family protein [Lutimonas vermicola]|uniref:SdpI family protein n=1 Tax=Lutimonas vermicola TaxID=414288 RepID=A0ABU9L656_9FLAO